jgi:hypothetical protein
MTRLTFVAALPMRPSRDAGGGTFRVHRRLPPAAFTEDGAGGTRPVRGERP